MLKKVRRGFVAASLCFCTMAASLSPAGAAPFSSDDRQLPYLDPTRVNLQDLNANRAVEKVSPNNLVTLGDSIFSNPTAGDAAYSMATRGVQDNGVRSALRAASPNISARGCAQGFPSIPKSLAANLNAPLNDYSCPGATLYSQSGGNTILSQVDSAVRDGALSPSTKYVAIQAGYNDVYNNYTVPSGERANDDQLAALLNSPTQRDLFARAMDTVIDRVKRAAPNAIVKLVGYHTITDDRPGGWQCLYHVGYGRGQDNVFDISYAFPIYWDTRGEINSNTWMQQAAERKNVGYIDTREFSKDHGECAAPEDRWVSGVLIDTTTSSYNLALHLTDVGVNEISRHVAAQYR